MNINGCSMAIFTYDNEQDYWNALAVVKRLGVTTKTSTTSLQSSRKN